jgi:hypothetical protein
MIKQIFCVDCKSPAPQEDTKYTLIGQGWRLRRRETAEGVVLEWRCVECWRKLKRVDPSASTGDFDPLASSSGRMPAGKRSGGTRD